MDEPAQMLANRVRKNARHRKKWAQRQGITCYRLYDRDIPEIPLCIDWYDGRLYVAHFARRNQPTPDIETLLEPVTNVLDVPATQVYIKTRERMRGSSQYARVGQSNSRFVVMEHNLKFWVNLSDYLDTGLFLDHRKTRTLVASQANKKRFLNLFGYTGAFSVHAAAAGASTTTVDTSNTYLAWAKENMHLNDLMGSQHRWIRSDVALFLDGESEAGSTYDLIVVDPPTFSNSKNLEFSFDVQRDHASLLNKVAKICAPEATVYFSTNARKFKLEDVKSQWQSVTEISAKTVPEDFKQKRPHRCWKLTANE